MPTLDDHRRLHGGLLLLAGLCQLGAGAGEPHAVRVSLALGASLIAAGAGLLLRQRWARGLGVGGVLALVLHAALRGWLTGAEVGAAGVVFALATLWCVVDLARTDVTEAEELARRERVDAARRLAAGRLRAKLAHLREHLEAVEEQVREAHEAEGHLEPFEDCEHDDCSQLRAHLAETWAKLQGADPTAG